MTKVYATIICIAIVACIIGGGIFTIDAESKKIEWSFPIPQEGKYINATSIEIKDNNFFYPRYDLPFNYTGRSYPNTIESFTVAYYQNQDIIGTNIRSLPILIGEVYYEFVVGK